MKNAPLVLLLSAVLLVTACSPSQPHIEVETLRFDFGEILLGTTARREMRLSNTGDATLVIDRIIGSCDCTMGTAREMTIQPGKTTTLRISFASAELYGAGDGPITRHVYIYSNDPAQPKLRIEFSGTIVRK